MTSEFCYTIDRALDDKLIFIADPILDPISWILDSLVRYATERKISHIHIMMGLAKNAITQLYIWDNRIIQTVEELKLNHSWLRQVSRHCSTVIREMILQEESSWWSGQFSSKHIMMGFSSSWDKDYAFVLMNSSRCK